MNIVSYKHTYKHTYNTYMQKYKINPLSHTYIYTYIHAFTKRDSYVFILDFPLTRGDDCPGREIHSLPG